MSHPVRAAAISGALLACLASGCSSGGGFGGTTPTRPAHPAHTGPAQPVAQPKQLTGAELSALIQGPPGFMWESDKSPNSGTQESTPVPGASNANAVTCAAWWAGKGYFGPGTVAYAINNYTGPGEISLSIEVNIYPGGDGATMFSMSVAEQRRCRAFTYHDQDGQNYAVHATVLPSLSIGYPSALTNATLTAGDGAKFTTQSTYVEVGDALVMATETGPARDHFSRSQIPLAKTTAALQRAGY